MKISPAAMIFLSAIFLCLPISSADQSTLTEKEREERGVVYLTNQGIDINKFRETIKIPDYKHKGRTLIISCTFVVRCPKCNAPIYYSDRDWLPWNALQAAWDTTPKPSEAREGAVIAMASPAEIPYICPKDNSGIIYFEINKKENYYFTNQGWVAVSQNGLTARHLSRRLPRDPTSYMISDRDPLFKRKGIVWEKVH